MKKKGRKWRQVFSDKRVGRVKARGVGPPLRFFSVQHFWASRSQQVAFPCWPPLSSLLAVNYGCNESTRATLVVSGWMRERRAMFIPNNSVKVGPGQRKRFPFDWPYCESSSRSFLLPKADGDETLALERDRHVLLFLSWWTDKRVL